MKECNLVLAIDTTQLENADKFSYWYDLMPEYRRKKIDAYKPKASKRLSLGAGIVLYQGLKRLGFEASDIGFEEGGKPYFLSADSLRFNLSHSGSLAVGAFSRGNVGIDIEQFKEFRENLVNFVYNDKEKLYIREHAADATQENAMYTKLWTMKESVMKYYGKGLSMDPRKIFIDQENSSEVYYDGKKMEDIFFTGFKYGDYSITVCSGERVFCDELEFVLGV